MDKYSPLQTLESYTAANRDLAVAMHQPPFRALLARAADVLESAYRHHKKMILIGNGGSASNAAHFVVDFTKGFTDFPGIKPFRSLALTDSLASVTAIGNDLSYDEVFSKQLETWAEPGDVLISISGSGNSPNIIKAVELAKKLGLTVIGLTGSREGSKLAQLADIPISTPTPHMQHMENAHAMVMHGLWLELLSRLTATSKMSDPLPDERASSDRLGHPVGSDSTTATGMQVKEVASDPITLNQPKDEVWCPLCQATHPVATPIQ